jgi:hypothetical protein
MGLVAGTKLINQPPFMTIECTASEATGATETTGSASLPVEVALSKFTLSGCSSGCSLSAVKPGRLSVTGIEGTMNGTVRWSGFELKSSCSSECVWGGEATKGITLKGGPEPRLKLEKVSIPRQSGSLTTCASMVWTGEYQISKPAPLYVANPSSWSAPGTGVLCPGNLSPCKFPGAGPYGAGTVVSASLKPATTSLFELGYANVKCEATAISGEVLSSGSSTEPVVGALSAVSFSSCNCKVTTLKTGNFSVSWSSGGNGQLALDGFELQVDCGGKECTLGGSVKEGIAVTGGNPASIKASSALLPKKAGVAECSSTPKWTAEYAVTAPKTLYVAPS